MPDIFLSHNCCQFNKPCNWPLLHFWHILGQTRGKRSSKGFIKNEHHGTTRIGFFSVFSAKLLKTCQNKEAICRWAKRKRQSWHRGIDHCFDVDPGSTWLANRNGARLTNSSWIRLLFSTHPQSSHVIQIILRTIRIDIIIMKNIPLESGWSSW